MGKTQAIRMGLEPNPNARLRTEVGSEPGSIELKDRAKKKT